MPTLISLIAFSGVILLSTSWSHAEQSVPPRDQVAQPGSAASAPLVYIPPHRGAPAPGRRIGGGTRSIEKKGPVVSVLAPDHVGLTTHDQPVLYWFVSEAVTTPIEVEVTLMEAEGVKPIMKAKLEPPVGPGIQRVNLSEHGVHLAPGAQYEWSVALVLDPKRRSRDIVVSGGIERVNTEQTATLATEKTPSQDTVSRSAKAGLWYDTLMSVSDLIEASPTNQSLRQQRAQLLDTAGLKEVGAYDRGN